jgi:hypothetical protein
LLILGQLRRRLIGILNGLRLAVGIELFIGLGVLVGLILIGWWGSGLLGLLRWSLWSIELSALWRGGLRANSEDGSLSGNSS